MSRPLDLLIRCRARGDACALVTLVGIHGAAPRRIGAQMAVSADGEVAGSFSGGCLDASVIKEAQRAQAERISRRVRYGADSPYVDIALPCGSGLDLQFDGEMSIATIDEIAQAVARREVFDLRWRDAAQPPECLAPASSADDETRVRHVPALRMLLAGAGETLLAMCKQARAAEIDVVALSPDRELRTAMDALGVEFHILQAQHALSALVFDAYTAAITLFHDHDWELPFLQQALASEACLVGAMGSPRAQAQRLEHLQARGVPPMALTRLRSPLGLLPRARDPQELAVSILAEALQTYRARCYPEPTHAA
jgi:xanthine dehydrogenase accessory factor